jgi:uncharacterized protein
MKQSLSAFFCAVIFGLGLCLSGMTQPEKVIGFLNIFHGFDPSLLFVMVGAIATHATLLVFIRRRKHPLLAQSFQIPGHTQLDFRLLAGSALFGVGWGLAGFCPGPAIVNLATFSPVVLSFTAAMLLGMLFHKLIVTKLLSRP